jgi:general secretion pathway protein A
MYWRHFNLTAEPFSLTPDPSFLYLSPVHAEAYAAMTMGLRERRGLITMIGEVGTGKTTLVYSLLSGLGPEIHTAYISNARLSFDGILRAALRDFGVPCESIHVSDLLDAFNRFLLGCAERGTTAALVIDEAQNLAPETFEDLRLLSNFETYTEKLLQIVLVGQPELDAKLRDPGLRQVAERVAVRCVVNPLSRPQTREYLEHRLTAVNGSLDLFTRAALRLLIARSRGIPRSVNILAHNAMLFAYGEGQSRVTRSYVAAAIREKTGRSLVRLWRRPRSRTAHDSISERRSRSWGALATAAVAGVLLGVTIAGGVRLVSMWTAGPAPTVVRAAPEPTQPTPAPKRRAALEAPRQRRAATEAAPIAPAMAVTPPSQAPDPVVAALPAAELALPDVATIHPSPGSSDEPEPAVAPRADAEPTAQAPTPVAAASVPDPAPVARAQAASPEAPPEAAPPPTPVSRPTAPVAAPATTTPARAPRPATPTPTPARVAAPAPRGAPASQPAAARPAPATLATATPPRASDLAATSASESNTIDPPRVKVVTVPEGSSLSDLMLAVYGQYSARMIPRVQAENPQVTNPDRILAGDRLRFPDNIGDGR